MYIIYIYTMHDVQTNDTKFMSSVGHFQLDSSSSFSMITTTQIRNTLLTSLMNIHITCCNVKYLCDYLRFDKINLPFINFEYLIKTNKRVPKVRKSVFNGIKMW
jgi:hypothetical protein